MAKYKKKLIPISAMKNLYYRATPLTIKMQDHVRITVLAVDFYVNFVRFSRLKLRDGYAKDYLNWAQTDFDNL